MIDLMFTSFTSFTSFTMFTSFTSLKMSFLVNIDVYLWNRLSKKVIGGFHDYLVNMGKIGGIDFLKRLLAGLVNKVNKVITHTHFFQFPDGFGHYNLKGQR